MLDERTTRLRRPPQASFVNAPPKRPPHPASYVRGASGRDRNVQGGREDVVSQFTCVSKRPDPEHHSFLYPDPSIGPVSPPITDPKSSLWSPLNRYLYIRLRWSVGLVDLYAGSSDPGSSAEAHDLKEAEAKTLLDSLQRWCVRVTKLRRNFVSCDDLRENGLCRRGTAALVVIDTRRNGVDCVDPPSAAKLEQRRMANEGTH
jgi:hypothetical protein